MKNHPSFKQLFISAIMLCAFLILLVPVQSGKARLNQHPITAEATPAPFAVPDAVKEKIEPEVIQRLAEAPQKLVPVIMTLKDKADLAAVVDGRDSKSLNEIKLQREEVVQALKEAAERSQPPVLALLNQGVQAKEVSQDVVSFFIINAIAASVNQDMLVKLAELPQVEHIYPDVIVQIPPEEMKAEQLSGNEVDVSGIGWGVAKLGADKVWNELGINGKGVVVGSIDTGVARDHPALKDKYRGNHTYQVYSFRDFVAMQPIPYDDHGHGTHVMGIIMGDGGPMQKIGVAPGAEWIAAKAIDAQGYGLGRSLLMAMEWMLAPDGVARLAPDIVSNSWGGPCDSRDVFFRQAIQSWRAAGIIPVFSAGNRGPKAGTVGSPGCFPEAIAVGATNEDDQVMEWSSRGPAFKDLLKPDFAAPGNKILSSIPPKGYAKFSGTSMAAPAVSGVIALMLQANPDLSFDQVVEILSESAVDLGKNGPDYDYGYGRIDAYKAVLASKGELGGYQLLAPKGSIAEKQPSYEWKIIPEAEKFQLKVSKKGGEQVLAAWYSAADICKGTTCTVKPSKSLESGTYEWQIQAATSQGVSPWSEAVAFTIQEALLPAPKPIAPQGKAAENPPTFEWEAVGAAQKYQLKVREESGKEAASAWYNASDICNAASCKVKIASALPQGSYRWQVQAAADSSVSVWSDELTFVVGQNDAPTIELIAPSGEIQDSSPTYQWKSASGASRYQLNVLNESNQEVISAWYEANAICKAKTCLVKTTQALANGAYTWRVRAATGSSNGEWSAPLAFKVTAPTLGSPQTVAPQGEIVENQPPFVWKAVNGASEYKLKVSKAAGEKVLTTWYAAADICKADQCSVQPGITLAEGTYLWQVQAGAGNVSGAWSAEVQFTVKAPPPTAPVLIAPLGDIKDPQPIFQWKPSKGASEYRLVVSGSAGDILRTWYKAQDVCQESNCSVKPNLTLESATYTWQVQAATAGSSAVWSEAARFTVQPSAPSVPVGIFPMEQIIEEQPIFRWSAVQGADEYQLKVVNEQGGVSFSKWYRHKDFCSAAVCSAKLSTRLEKGSYIWQVQSANLSGSSAWSEALRFTLRELAPEVKQLFAPSGNISEALPVFKWSAVPNAMEYEIKVSDANRRLVLSGKYTAADVCSAAVCSARHTMEIAPGAYVWQVRASNKDGAGAWSREMAFVVSEAPLPAANLIAPQGVINHGAPKFEWYYVPKATHYQLKVSGPAGSTESVFQMKYSADQICSGARCAVSLPMQLASGSYTWQVMTANTANTGTWSWVANFIIQPPQIGNLTPTAKPTALPSPTAVPSNTYIVQPGDSLVSLARRWGVSVETLSALNNIPYPYILRAGQVIKKP